MPNVCSFTPPKKPQLRAPLSPLQTAWTGERTNIWHQCPSHWHPFFSFFKINMRRYNHFAESQKIWRINCIQMLCLFANQVCHAARCSSHLHIPCQSITCILGLHHLFAKKKNSTWRYNQLLKVTRYGESIASNCYVLWREAMQGYCLFANQFSHAARYSSHLHIPCQSNTCILTFEPGINVHCHRLIQCKLVCFSCSLSSSPLKC